MNKKELIENICELEKDANPKALANFSVDELQNYLRYLMELYSQEKPVSAGTR